MHINSGLFISDSAKSNPWHSLSLPESAQNPTWNPDEIMESESYTLNPKLDPFFENSEAAIRPQSPRPKIAPGVSLLLQRPQAYQSQRHQLSKNLKKLCCTLLFPPGRFWLHLVASLRWNLNIFQLLFQELSDQIGSQWYCLQAIPKSSNRSLESLEHLPYLASLIHSSYPSPSSSFNHSNPPWKRMDQPPASWSSHWSCSRIPITMSPSKSRPTTLSLR